LKYIIRENEQIIKVRGRKFYYPPKDKWIEDKYLDFWSVEKLRRLGIYKLVVTSFDRSYYKETGYTIEYNDDTMIATKTFEFEPGYDSTYWRNRKRKQYKKEGIQLYADAIKIEPILEFTNDTADLTTYKQAVRDAFVAARQELNTILNDETLDDFQKYEAFNAHQIVWPDPPLSEEDLADYGL
jgi:hypothetical protein